MAGATIDHMISLTILIAALLITMMTYNGLFASAVDYDRNRQIANKAIDLMNTICLSPGNPVDWGESNDTILGFGLQDPEIGGYALSPYSIMRLQTNNSSQLLEYPPGSGNYYNNMSANYGDAILVPVGSTINHTTVSELLGINGTYGFSIDITPTLDVDVSKVPGYGHLVLKVVVSGGGVPLSGANLVHHLLLVGDSGSTPTITPYSGVNQTNQFGAFIIEYEDIDEVGDAYQFMVYASLNGISGMGYYSQDDLGGYPQFVVPLINDYDEGIILIAHSWGVHEHTETPVPAVNYYATFFTLTSDFQLQQVHLENSTALLNYGTKDYETTQIPASEIGFLFVSYEWGNRVGSVAMPWGIGTLGVSPSFRTESGLGASKFVATELRQVTINGVAYQIKVATWSLTN